MPCLDGLLLRTFRTRQDRQRSTVSVVVNDIRRLRNRVYHNEPICWRLNQLQGQHQKILQPIALIEPQLHPWLQQLERFPAVLELEQPRRSTHRTSAAS